MEKKPKKNEQVNKPAGGRGGKRPGAGRPKGARDQITIKALLETIDAKTGGRDYEELLVEDFLRARSENDTQTVIKYHNLILNKVMNSLAKIEVTDSQDAIAAKQAAFAEALSKLTGVSQEIDK